MSTHEMDRIQEETDAEGEEGMGVERREKETAGESHSFHLASDHLSDVPTLSLPSKTRVVPVSSSVERGVETSFRDCDQSMDAIFSGDLTKMPTFVNGCINYLSVGLPSPSSNQREYVLVLAQRATHLVQAAFDKSTQAGETKRMSRMLDEGKEGDLRPEGGKRKKDLFSEWRSTWSCRVLSGALLTTEWRAIGGFLLLDKIGVYPTLLLALVTYWMDGVETALFQILTLSVLFLTNSPSAWNRTG